MDDGNGKPVGGKYSYDAENRFPWKGEPAAPVAPVYEADEIDREVEALVRSHYGEHPGSVDLSAQATSAKQIEEALQFALDCLPNFGTYEDAMSEKSRGLFHSRLATLVNLHRLMPRRLVEAALASKAPINSVEGFVTANDLARIRPPHPRGHRWFPHPCGRPFNRCPWRTLGRLWQGR